MNAQKFTQKSLEALQSAQDLATEYQNMQIEQQHLLYALIAQEDGLIGQMLKKMEIDPAALLSDVRAEVERLPRVSGPGREPGQDLRLAGGRPRAGPGGKARRPDEGRIRLGRARHGLALLENPNGALGQLLSRFRLTKDGFLLGAGERARQHPRHLRHPGGHL